MSLFTDNETQSAIIGLSEEARQKPIHDLFDSIKRTCEDSIPLSNVLDAVVLGKCIPENVDNICTRQTYGFSYINLYPCNTHTNDIFPYMCAVFRYGMRIKNFAQALSVYAHSPNTFGGDEKTILIITDSCNPEFMDIIEDSLADVYFTGKLAVIIMLFTDYSCSEIPFYMNYRWNGPTLVIKGISDVIAQLGSPIIYEENDYRFAGPGVSRRYSIEIASITDTKVINKITNTEKIVKGRTARRFIQALWNFDQNEPMNIGCHVLDDKTYNIIFSNRNYRGLLPNDNRSLELIEIFENLIGNF